MKKNEAEKVNKALNKLTLGASLKLYSVVRDVDLKIKGKNVHLAVGIFYKGIVSLENYFIGISQESYEKYKDQVEKAIQIGLEKKRKEILKSSWVVRTLAGIIMYHEGTNYSDGLDLYRLTAKVPRNVWYKISDLFFKVDGNSEIDMMHDIKYGYYTTQPAKVQDVLLKEAESIATDEERQMAEQIVKKREENEKVYSKMEKIKKKIKSTASEITDYLKKNGKYLQTKEKIRLDGDWIENPNDPPDIYGGGSWFVIDEKNKKLWYVEDNGADGDNWSYNNIETGGAGAIGIFVAWNQEIYNKIMKIKELTVELSKKEEEISL